ncbi:MAG TPA: prolipoprotein diacylglyceryl transferase, partial [Cryomorphaceae bacterium]|nr:prolipoprotein diacylglyceryl transferase [Cryomorphaceae bacterium]
LLFGFRFFIEYLKEIQVSFEQTMSLNMGQWLSIPLVSIGVLLVVISKKEKL